MEHLNEAFKLGMKDFDHPLVNYVFDEIVQDIKYKYDDDKLLYIINARIYGEKCKLFILCGVGFQHTLDYYDARYFIQHLDLEAISFSDGNTYDPFKVMHDYEQ